jgi:3',5'-cyclic AMP phosphodiesterase CpdA
MPVYLPPISRRKFLTRSLGAAAALALGQGCASTKTKNAPHSVALLSDIHIAADPNHIARNINMTDHLKTVTGEVIAWPQRPEMVLVNGDLAFNSGGEDDYGAVMGLLRPLRENGMPLHLNMGNHDNREHFWSVMRKDQSIPAKLPGRQATIIRTDTVNWFMLDSLIKTLTTPGRLGEEQLTWLTNALDANTDKPAIIMVHHQPGSLSPTHQGGGLEDAVELLAVLRPRKQVKAYFFGHTHRWSVTQDDSGIHLINLPTVAYVFDEGQPNGWVHATVQDSGVRLELRCLDKTRKDHGQAVNLDWRTV